MLGENRQKRGNGVVIDAKQTTGSVVLIAGVDAGSTETRVCLSDYNDAQVFADNSRMRNALDALLTTYRIPSTYAEADDSREISPVSDALDDNYDSVVILVHNTADKPLLGRTRVLRGRKIQDAMGVVPQFLDSSTNKTDNVIFYTNIIDALGYAVMQKYNGAIPAEVNIYLTLSVRPKELTSFCKKKMNENLVGSFMYNWRSISMKINICGLDFTTEPEAEISGTTTVYDLRAACGIDAQRHTEMANRLDGSDCFVHIEGGGSSIGVEVLRGGSILDACSSTFPLGGNYMAQVFIDQYRENTGRTVTRDAANGAIINCTLRDGRNVVDVSQLVSQCKNQVARSILEGIRHDVIDVMSDLTLRDIEFFTLGGRLFAPDEGGTTIGEYFTKYVQQLAPNTDVITLPENFIAQGNLVIGLNSDSAAKLRSAPPPVRLMNDGPGASNKPAEDIPENEDIN